MSVSLASSQPFLGGLWDSRELHASEIHPELYQGPIPAHLQEDLEDEPLPRPRKAPAPIKGFEGMSDEERRERARRGAQKRWHGRENPYPCAKCGKPTHGRGKGKSGLNCRRCSSCDGFFTVDPGTDALIASEGKRVAILEPCPHCPGSTRSKGRDYRVCDSCGRYVRKTPDPNAKVWPPCLRCGGSTVGHGLKCKGTVQVLICHDCGKTCRVPAERSETP